MSTTQLNAKKQIRAGTIDTALLSTELQDQLTGFGTNISNIQGLMSTDAERIAAVSALTTAFQGADQTLQGALEAATTAWNQNIADEASSRTAADEALQVAIDAAVGNLTAIDLAYKAADQALQAAIDAAVADIVTLQSDLTAETDRATAAEAALISNQKRGVVLTGVIDGVNNVFTVPEAFHANTLEVQYNGMTVYLTDDYSINGSGITLLFAPEAGDKVRANYLANPA